MNREELLNLLSPVRRFVSGKSGPVDVYKQLCLKDNLAVAYNGTSGYCIRCTLGVDCLVSPDELIGLLDKLSSEEVRISQTSKGLSVRGASTKAMLRTSDSASFPDFIPSEYSEIGHPGNLVQCLKTCVSMSNATLRNQFPGVAISGKYVYSTDGFCATRCEMDGPVLGGLHFLPISSAKSLTKLPEPVKLISFGNLVGALFEDPPGLWCSSVLSDTFPKKHIDEFFSRPAEEHLTVEAPDDLEAALSRLSLIGGESSRGVEFWSEAGTLHIRASTKARGELQEKFCWEFPHDFKTRIDPRRMRAALQVGREIDLANVVTGLSRNLIFRGDRQTVCMSTFA